LKPHKLKKIAIAGFHHETNTFSSTTATFEDFQKADGWPELSMGEALLKNLYGANIPISGFIAQAKLFDMDVIPILWCSAQPSGAVEAEAYEKIVTMMCNSLKQHRDIDAVFLDLHGAMVATHMDDGEAELMRRIRKIIGHKTPLYVVLDLHANVSVEMFEIADFIMCYRHYPHTDMAETGAKVCIELNKHLNAPTNLYKGYAKFPFLIPITAQCTLDGAGARLVKHLDTAEAESQSLSLSFAYGFPMADVSFAGPTLMVYSGDEADVTTRLSETKQKIISLRNEFASPILSAEQAVSEALLEYSNKPIVVADTQDNPGAGGSSDTMGMLRELVRQNAQNSVIAIVCDPEAAAIAHSAGEGREIAISLGEKSFHSTNSKPSPFNGMFMVEKITDSPVEPVGSMYKGSMMNLGKMALLSHRGVKIIVSSVKQQAADRGILLHMGINPEEMKIIVLKSSVHFRADFAQIAGKIIIAESAGVNIANPANLDYKKYNGDKGIAINKE
jgi:microcystin degradation protein MlrC